MADMAACPRLPMICSLVAAQRTKMQPERDGCHLVDRDHFNYTDLGEEGQLH
jgi:hypothetical protein